MINKFCEVNALLTTAVERAEVYAIARMIILAWHEREKYLLEQQLEIGKPWCVTELEKALGIPQSFTIDVDGADPLADFDFGSLDFEMIDWSFWETSGFGKGAEV